MMPILWNNTIAEAIVGEKKNSIKILMHNAAFHINFNAPSEYVWVAKKGGNWICLYHVLDAFEWELIKGEVLFLLEWKVDPSAYWMLFEAILYWEGEFYQGEGKNQI